MAWPLRPRSLADSVLVKAIEGASSQERLLCALLWFGTYLALASSQRFQRCRKLYKEYPFSSREAMSRMTDHDPLETQEKILQMEFLFTMLKSLQFALSRVGNPGPLLPSRTDHQQTYGIPAISSLLFKTSQFSNSATSFKRYADTGTLIGELMAFKDSVFFIVQTTCSLQVLSPVT